MEQRWVKAKYSWPAWIIHAGEAYALCPECAAEAEGEVQEFIVYEVESPDVCDVCGRFIVGPTVTSAAGCAYEGALEGLEALGDARRVDPASLDTEELKDYKIDPLSSAYGTLTAWPEGQKPSEAWDVYDGQHLILWFEGLGFLALTR